MESIRIPINNDWGVVETQSANQKAWGYRFYPDKVKGEGLFAACLRKKDHSGDIVSFKNNNNQKVPGAELEMVKKYINNPADYYFFKVGDEWMAISHQHKENLQLLGRHLYIKKSGVRIGQIMGKDLIPDHELALSIIINKEAVLQTPLNYDEAILFLRRENLQLYTTNKGWSLMTYEGQPLGWAKLLPNRINNYYPKELRILSQKG